MTFLKFGAFDISQNGFNRIWMFSGYVSDTYAMYSEINTLDTAETYARNEESTYRIYIPRKEHSRILYSVWSYRK